MWSLINELCGNPSFHALMYIVIFAILGYLFKQKVGRKICEVQEMQVKQDLKEVKEQNQNLSNILIEQGKLLATIGNDVKWLKDNNGK